MARTKPPQVQQYAQGDLLFTRVAKMPAGTPTSVAAGARHILALGEATGHHHSFIAPKRTMVLDEGNVTYLTLDELTEVTHQEHGAVALEPGTWQVTRQREATDDDEQWANVID